MRIIPKDSRSEKELIFAGLQFNFLLFHFSLCGIFRSYRTHTAFAFWLSFAHFPYYKAYRTGFYKAPHNDTLPCNYSFFDTARKARDTQTTFDPCSQFQSHISSPLLRLSKRLRKITKRFINGTYGNITICHLAFIAFFYRNFQGPAGNILMPP